MQRVLIIEDDPVLQRHLQLLLEGEGFACEGVRTLSEARSKITPSNIYSAAIVDWSLPDGEGIEWVVDVRRVHPKLAVVMLTARAEVSSRVTGLKLGATDYIVKPFEPAELVARIQRHIAQANAVAVPSVEPYLKFAGIILDTGTYKVTWQGMPVELTKLQFSLLRFLMSHPNHVFSRDELLEQVWGLERYPTTRTVDNHIVQLRQRFDPKLFETVHGVGYKFVAVD